MTFDAQGLLANLAEKERVQGHHSPEGRAIRTLSRALSGWSAAALSAGDVLVLCERAMEDWLKARLGVSPWSARGLPDLLPAAIERGLVAPADAASLKNIDAARERPEADDVNGALALCIRVVEKNW